MATPKLSKLELQIMQTLWDRGESSIREIQEAFPEKGRPGYTTIQMTIYRMEVKKVVRQRPQSRQISTSSGAPRHRATPRSCV